jgi:xanthine dehydrogenase accessory factor
MAEAAVASAVLPRDSGHDPDDPASVFELLSLGAAEGLEGALLTIVNIEGGAPRALGAQMAVLTDGRYCGYVSGGCVEAAVAAEAIRAIAAGKDEVLRFGTGSRFIDIRLPCGGSIDVHVHVRPDPAVLSEAQRLLAARATFAIALQPEGGVATLIPGSGTRERSEWRDAAFLRHYHPLTQLLLIGEGHELAALSNLACSAGLQVCAYVTSDAGADGLAQRGATVTQVPGEALPQLTVDPFTAIVFVLHDRFKESRLLEAALGYEPFYIGALGSRRAHATRVERLQAAGVDEDRIARLHGPIGLYGPTRTASALAISVLAEITEARMKLDG